MSNLDQLHRLNGYSGQIPFFSGRMHIVNVEYLDKSKNIYYYQAPICSEYRIMYFFFDSPQDVELYKPKKTMLSIRANHVLSLSEKQRHRFCFMPEVRPNILILYYQFQFRADPAEILTDYLEDEEGLFRAFFRQPYSIMAINQRLMAELEMTNEYLRTSTKGDVLKLRNQMSNIMLTVCQQNNFESGKNFNENLRKALSSNKQSVLMQHILECVTYDMTLGEVSHELHYVPRHVQRLVSKSYGESFAKTVQNFRISYTMCLLHDTNMSLGEICEKTGFPNEKSMCQSFRTLVGMSPIEFRKRLGANLSKCRT